MSGTKDGTGGHIREAESTSEAFPDLGVEKLEVDGGGWIERGEIIQPRHVVWQVTVAMVGL